jgi:hypothetical protein
MYHANPSSLLNMKESQKTIEEAIDKQGIPSLQNSGEHGRKGIAPKEYLWQ